MKVRDILRERKEDRDIHVKKEDNAIQDQISKECTSNYAIC